MFVGSSAELAQIKEHSKESGNILKAAIKKKLIAEGLLEK